MSCETHPKSVYWSAVLRDVNQLRKNNITVNCYKSTYEAVGREFKFPNAQILCQTN